MPVQDGLICWLDGRDGNNTDKTATWVDRSGNGNNATLHDFAFINSSGWYEGGIVHDGLSYVKLPRLPQMDKDLYTVEVLFENYDTTSVETIVFGNPQGGATFIFSTGSHFGTASRSEVSFGIYSGGYKGVGGLPVANGEKVLLAGVKNGSEGTHYKNGVFGKTSTLGLVTSIGNQFYSTFSDPNETGITNGRRGKIYSIRIYNRALSETELLHNYNYEQSIPIPPKILRIELDNTASTYDLTKSFKSYSKLVFNGTEVTTIPASTAGTLDVYDAVALDAYSASITTGIPSMLHFGKDGLNKLNTDNMTSARSMFFSSKLLSVDLGGFSNTSKVTSMKYMFRWATGLTTLDFSKLDTSNVTDFGYLLEGCSNLTSVNLTGMNTAKATSTMYMFSDCSKLTSIDVSGFNTANVVSMFYMFKGCTSATYIPTANFNTAKVTEMYYMFASCNALTDFQVQNFNVANVTDFSYMFTSCRAVTTLDLSNWITAKAVNMGSMFMDCKVLKYLKINKFVAGSVSTGGTGIITLCPALTDIDLSDSSVTLATVTKFSSAFNLSPAKVMKVYHPTLHTGLSNTYISYSYPTLHQLDSDMIYLMNMQKNTYTVTGADISLTANVGAGADKHVGGVLHPNGKIYYTSYNRHHESLDVTTGTLTQFTNATGAYNGCTLDESGNIYAFGLSSTSLIRLNVDLGTSTSFPIPSGGYGATILAKDGNIYGLPSSSGQVAMFNVTTEQISYFGTLGTGSFSWLGGSYGKDGKVYCFPRYGTGILQIDLLAKTIVVMTSTIGNGYAGSVTWIDGNIYATPIHSGGVGKLDVTTGTFTKIGTLGTNNEWHGGVLGANGKIYFAPRNSHDLLEFDPATNTFITFALGTSLSNKWHGGVLHTNGKIYFTPHYAEDYLVVNTGTLITSQVANTKYFNKF